MALIKCPECGKENVSDSAQCCPECGFGIHDYFVKQQNERMAKENAVSAAQKAKVQKEKEAEELKHRLANIKVPEEPRKGVYVAGGAVCGIIGVLWLVMSLYDGFHFFKFCIAAFFFIMASTAYSVYKDAVSDYNLSQTDFSAYQQKVIRAEDARKAEEIRIANEKAEKASAPVKCPKCGSTSIATVNRGYSLVWGFIGSGKPMNVCQKCGYKFDPKK